MTDEDRPVYPTKTSRFKEVPSANWESHDCKRKVNSIGIGKKQQLLSHD